VPLVVLVPADMFRPRRPDEHFAAEAAAWAAAGQRWRWWIMTRWPSLEARSAAERVGESADGAVYRGWMLSSGQYAALAGALADRPATTTPDAFVAAILAAAE
jgi:hypothetical protein